MAGSHSEGKGSKSRSIHQSPQEYNEPGERMAAGTRFEMVMEVEKVIQTILGL